jgi:hypothetical protein
MFTTGTPPRFADDGSCQHHLEHALQVQYESAQNFISFYHQKNEIKDRAWVHNSHRKQQNTHKNSETKVGNHRNPLPLWQTCIYPTFGTGDLQCSLGFLPLAAIHRALPWCLSPGTHLSHSHLKHVSTHFQLPSRGKKKQPNRLLSKSHETHCDLLMTESAATPRTHLTQAQKTKNNNKKKKKRTLQLRNCLAATIIP